MHSIYVIAVYWSLWSIWCSVLALRLISKIQVHSVKYTKYQSNQLRLANRRLIVHAASTADVAVPDSPSGLTLTVPEGHHVMVTDSNGITTVHTGVSVGFTGQEEASNTLTGANTLSGGASGTVPRRRLGRKPPLPPKPRAKKKIEEPVEPVEPVPVSPDNAFFDDPRME